MSQSRQVAYYFNAQTNESSWDPPAGLSRKDVLTLPGAKYLDAPSKVRASHLLVKHNGSRRASSWKEVGNPCSCFSRPSPPPISFTCCVAHLYAIVSPAANTGHRMILS